MAKKIGDNRNVNTELDSGGGVALNGTPSTLVAANENRINFSISNDTNRDVMLQYDLGGVFTDAVLVYRKSYWEMPRNQYTGEIKAYTLSGAGTVTICEY